MKVPGVVDKLVEISLFSDDNSMRRTLPLLIHSGRILRTDLMTEATASHPEFDCEDMTTLESINSIVTVKAESVIDLPMSLFLR